jgi:uncharacterized protein (TIGR02246 family)
MTATTEQRIQLIEDKMDIESLMARYARYVDNGWAGAIKDSAALADLFTEDGVWTSPAYGAFEGRQAIAENLGGVSPRLTVHQIFSPDVKIEGDEAIGTWRLIIAMTAPDGQALLGFGGYRLRLVRTAEGWRIRHLQSEPAFMAPYGQSWVKA